MKKITIEIEDTPYQVLVADTDETRTKGLMGISAIPKKKGMLFKWDEPGRREMWQKNCLIPMLQAFLNEDMEIVKVLKREPHDETLMGFDGIQYVLELNADEDVKEGDEVEIPEPKEGKMVILGSDGQPQFVLKGGERIFSRKSTKVLIRKAKKAYSVKDDEIAYERACKSLGKYMFKELSAQDSRKPEYVQAPNKD